MIDCEATPTGFRMQAVGWHGQGEVLLAQGDIDRGLASYAEAAKLFPDDRVILRGHAEALLRAGRAQEVLKAMAEYERLHDKDAAMYKLEARAYQLNGKDVEANLAMAEHYYLSGNMGAAMAQLRQASRRKDADYFVSSRVAARLRDLEEEQAASIGEK